SLLMNHSPDSIYRFLSQLFAEVKRYEACFIAVAEEDMHAPNVIASIEQIFDGVLRVAYGEDGSLLVEVKKMVGADIPSRSRTLIQQRSIAGQDKKELEETSGRKRIAVLPLVSFSPDPNDEFFADGLTEELIDRLCQVRELEVIARTSVMAYKNKEKKIAEIGKELKVGTLVEGSVRKAGNRIRVTAQLIDARTEGHLWSSRYDNELEDIFAVQSDIAEKITKALKLNLVAPEAETPKKSTPVTEAYVYYLNGVHLRHKATEEGLRKAVQYLEKAIELDPDYADAFAQIAINLVFIGIYWMEPLAQAFSKARNYATKALEIDPKNTEALYAKGWISYFYDWNWMEAEKEARLAISLNPSYSEPRITLAWLLLALGRNSEAVEEARKAVDLDPLGVYSRQCEGRVLASVGKFHEAIITLNTTLEIEPSSSFLHTEMGYTYLSMGKVEEGLGEMEKLLKLPSGEFFKMGLGYAYAVSGRREDALNIAKELELARSKGLARPYEIAMIYSGLGENSKALDLLEQAFEEKTIIHLLNIRVEPAFANLRSEPRFRALLKKLNLPV
ncbi:MAG TPA: hypothetical protein VJN71_08210, partial [Nitrososphaerales archaeon]|nr:hypothetical protein [Nitrososphaerales archaeon]